MAKVEAEASVALLAVAVERNYTAVDATEAARCINHLDCWDDAASAVLGTLAEAREVLEDI